MLITKLPVARAHAEVGVQALDPGEEAEYEALSLLGQRLHVPILEAFWEMEARDGQGKLLGHLRQRSHSFVRNAYNHLISQVAAKNGDGGSIFGGGFINIKDTGGAVRSGSLPILVGHKGTDTSTTSLEIAGGVSHGIRGGPNDSDKGILVGSGANPESFEDYALQSLISTGTGAGQLSYVAGEAAVVSYVAGTKTLTVTHARFFNNNSGGGIDVNEVGIHVYGKSGA
ncbi:MAG: hypothetical protein Q7K03_07325, partial [Dehalococcoidia bacterium]|nr:hypothetical protein [Dehalococcoidia bacterium]